MVVRNSEMFGVRRNGTGRLASRSPVASLMSKRKYETFSFPVSYKQKTEYDIKFKEQLSSKQVYTGGRFGYFIAAVYIYFLVHTFYFIFSTEECLHDLYGEKICKICSD